MVVPERCAGGERGDGPDQQQTSAEIRAYWDEQKRMGTSIGGPRRCGGFYTRTEDEAKVKQWDASLKPKRGFLVRVGLF